MPDTGKIIALASAVCSPLKEAITPREASINLFNPNDPDILPNGYLDYITGAFTAYSGYFEAGYISGKPGDTFTVVSNGNYVNVSSGRMVCFYDEDKNFISGTVVYNATFTMPSGAYYMRYCLKTSENVNLMIVKNDNTIHDYVPYDPGKKGVDDVLNTVFGSDATRTINLFNSSDPDMLTGGKYIDASGNVQSLANYNETGFIPCSKGDTITFSAKGSLLSSTRIAVYYNENKQYISGNANATMPTVTIPNNDSIAYIRIPVKNDEISTLMATLNDTVLHTYVPYIIPGSEGLDEKVGDLEKDGYPWKGKSVVLLGDSITYMDGHDGIVGYPHYIAELGFSEVTNNAKNGACIAYHSERSSYEDICTTVDNVTFSGYDLAIIAGGINDFYATSASPIGTLVNSVTAGDFTKTDFIGALQYIITKILTAKPSIKIALMTPLKKSNWLTANSQSKVLKDYVDAIKEVGEYYAIPVLDFFSESGINAMTFSTFTSDSLHPNNDGYKFVSRKLKAFINGI